VSRERGIDLERIEGETKSIDTQRGAFTEAQASLHSVL
jgi:hypothetical protein